MENFTIPDLPAAPGWSVFVGNLGAVLIGLAGVAFLAAFLSALFGHRAKSLEKVSAVGMWVGTLSLFGAMACLAALFVDHRFEWKYVRNHSDLLTPLSYRIAAVWSGQEGSFLLWGSLSALFALLTMKAAGLYRRWYIVAYSAFLASIAAILNYESPFILLTMHGKPIVPPDGAGLSPQLLNYWVVIHPPTIFVGFSSLTILFAYAFSAMMNRNPVDWIPRVRPWALFSLAILGLGLCMGGFWAYETLGWGGFWMWDPVENTSFVPWCLLVAFIHGILVQTARGKWIAANLLMAGLPFLSFVYGTFLTRSGFLGDTSVHSFAEMDRSALWILIAILATTTLGFLSLWFWQGRRLKREFEAAQEPTQGLVREETYRYGNLLMILFALVTGVGMSWPAIMSMTGQTPKIVEEKLYHQVLPYAFIPVMILMAVAPFTGWKKTDWKSAWGKLYAALCLTIAVSGVVMLIVARTEWAGFIENKDAASLFFGRLQVPAVPWTLALATFCFLVMVANLIRLVEVFKRSKMGIGGFLSHFGVAMLLAGLIMSRGMEQKEQFLVQEGSSNAALGYIVTAKGHTTDDVMRRDNKVMFDVQRGTEVKEYRPGMYFMPDQDGDGQPNPMVWPYIDHRFLYDVYFTLHPMELNASEPTPMKPGETKNFDKFTITYLRLTRDGEAGKEGTVFGAQLRVTDRETKESFDANPGWRLANPGVEQVPAVFGDYFMTVQAMDAGSQSFTLQLHFRKPLYPIELYVKPFTGFVWLGTGILTFALLLTAFYRRAPKPSNSAPVNEPAAADKKPEDDNALAPLA